MFSHKAHAVDPNHDVSSLVSSDPVISKLAAWHVWPLKQGPIGSSSLPKQTNQTNKPDKQTNMHHSSTKINQIAVLPFFFSIFPYLPQNQPPPPKKKGSGPRPQSNNRPPWNLFQLVPGKVCDSEIVFCLKKITLPKNNAQKAIPEGNVESLQTSRFQGRKC